MSMGLTTSEVEAICRKALPHGVEFYGVVAAHKFPPFTALRGDKPMAFVANTHTKDRPGEHRAACWLPKRGGKPLMFSSRG